MLLVALVVVAVGSVLCALAGSLHRAADRRAASCRASAARSSRSPSASSATSSRARGSPAASRSCRRSSASAAGWASSLAGPIVERLGLPLDLLDPADRRRSPRWSPPSSSCPSRPSRRRAASTRLGAAAVGAGWSCLLRRRQPGQRPGAGRARASSACSRSPRCCRVAWVRSEQRSREPLVDMQMMRVRGVWTVNLAALMLGAGDVQRLHPDPDVRRRSRPAAATASAPRSPRPACTCCPARC